MDLSTQEDIPTPLNVPLSAKYIRSFAYSTMKDRIPIILTKTLDGLVREKDTIALYYGEEAREELKKVIGCISQLKNELQTDKPLLSLNSSAGLDADIWNEYLKNVTKETGITPSYFQTEWLFAECYIYRRLREAFLLTEHLQNLDPFHSQKADALEQALPAIKPLAIHMKEVITSNKCTTKDEIKSEFIKLLKIALWGNKCDLSLSCGGSVSVDDNPLDLIKQFDSAILVDQSQEIWNALADCKGETVDIILDNAGYEVVTDLCLAEFLLSKCDIAKVRFRGKQMPWYISDVMEKDFHYVLNFLAEKDEPYRAMADRWLNYLKESKFHITSDQFWTLPYSFNHMERVDKNLYDNLKTSKLLIFKGDLNYRKLVGDINWSTTYPFKNSLRGFHPSPLVTLRTIKADTICGLKPGQAEATEAESPTWLLTGDYAVIQFDSEKHSL